MALIMRITAQPTCFKYRSDESDFCRTPPPKKKSYCTGRKRISPHKKCGDSLFIVLHSNYVGRYFQFPAVNNIDIIIFRALGNLHGTCIAVCRAVHRPYKKYTEQGGKTECFGLTATDTIIKCAFSARFLQGLLGFAPLYSAAFTGCFFRFVGL